MTDTETVVVAECIGCRAKRDIRAGEVAADDVPICESCFMPMIAKRTKRVKRIRLSAAPSEK